MKRQFVEAGVFIRPFGRIVYITPPLVIGAADLTTLTSAMVRAVSEMDA